MDRWWAVISCGAVCDAVQGGSHYWDGKQNPKAQSFKWELLSGTFFCWCLHIQGSSNFWEG